MEHIELDDCVLVKEVAESTEAAENMENGRIFGLIPVFVLIIIMFIRIVFVLYKSKGELYRSFLFVFCLFFEVFMAQWDRT